MKPLLSTPTKRFTLEDVQASYLAEQEELNSEEFTKAEAKWELSSLLQKLADALEDKVIILDEIWGIK